MLQRIELAYKARGYFVPFHRRTARWSCIVAHRRAGKTVACVLDAIDHALRCKHEHGRYAYVAPFLAQAKKVAWQYLCEYAQPVAVKRNEGELWIEVLGGARIWIHGADNPDSLRGSYLDGVVLDEYADMRPSVWGAVIRPMLADYRGWATFIGTPKGHNSFYEIFQTSKTDPDWYSLLLLASETGIVSAAELEDSRRTMTKEQYEQEFECSFEAAILGSYFGREMADAERLGRVTDVAYDENLPVHTAWDLGKGSNMAVWFWQVGFDGVRVIDHLEGEHSEGLPQICEHLERKPYRYGFDYVPHDAKATEIGTGRTRVETLFKLGRNPKVVADHKVMDGINAARLTVPYCWFDRERCAGGIEALKQYKAAFDEKVRAYKNEPQHDWTSHTADAFRYLAMAWRAMALPEPAPPSPEPFRGIGQITVDELVKLVEPKTLRV